MAVFLMFVGTALFGVVTEGIAAYYVEGTREGEETVTTKDLTGKLKRLEARLVSLQQERGDPS